MFNSAKIIFFILVIFYFTACSSLQRSPQSGYHMGKISGQSLEQAQFKARDHLALLSELGIAPESLNTEEGLNKYNQLVQLRSLEKSLFNEREKRQYYNTLPWLKDESERLEFLQQPNYAARQLWLRKNTIGSRPTSYNAEAEDIIEQKDISLGMPTDHVRRSWGKPDVVETAGNPMYRNERWKYQRYISSAEGYRLQNRTVYFEGGKVIGWENDENN